MAHIGLFPLGIVLFPAARYPLHIFEERYKTLVQRSIEGKVTIGINLVEEGKLYQLGCTATVDRVLKTYDDGRMDIVVRGGERYVIQRYFTDEEPYLTAEVDGVDDTEQLPSSSLLLETVALYNQLVETVYDEGQFTLEATEWLHGGGAFRMAQKVGMEATLRQRLLEMRNEDERLTTLRDWIAQALPTVRTAKLRESLARNDGYLSPEERED